MTNAKWDQSVFNKTLKRYSEVCKSRTFPQILNSKGYFIARAATWFTRKADKNQIVSRLASVGTVRTVTKKGKVITRRKIAALQTTNYGGRSVPLAALIIQKQRANLGIRSPFYNRSRAAGAAAMTKAILRFIGIRVRSIAFIKGGWLPAIKKLAPLANKSGQPQMDGNARQYGEDKGSAIPATPGKLVVQIINTAFGNKSGTNSRGRALGFAQEGEQRAFANETASMNQYTEDHMKADIEEFNRAQH